MPIAEWLPSIVMNIATTLVMATAFVVTIKASVSRLSDSVDHIKEAIDEIKSRGERVDGKVEKIDRRLTIMEVKNATSCGSSTSLRDRIDRGMQNDHDDGA